MPTVNEPRPATAIAKSVKLEGEELSEQIMAILKDEVMNLNDKLAMLTKMAEAEDLKPSSLAEATCCPDWPDWE